MNLQLKHDHRPLYVQAVEVLKALIAETPYRPGEKLPPELTLARQLGISRTTLRMALGHLELQGVIQRRQGVGTFVAPQKPDPLEGGLQSLTSVQALARLSGLAAQTTQRALSQLPATAGWAELLDLPSATPLWQVRCAVAIEGRPVADLRSLMPVDQADESALASAEGSLLEYLIARGSPRLTYTRSRVYASEADAILAATLDVTEGRALLHLREVYFDEDDRPVALSFNYFVSDRFNFYIRRQIS